jgi:hypothetical protein
MPDTPRGRRYAKPMVVADDLALLRGPTAGVVTLPPRLDWSGSPSYDLNSPGRLVDLYRTVLIEAIRPDDLHAYLDRATLRQLWSSLWLPQDLRRAWEQRFPELSGTDTGSAAA